MNIYDLEKQATSGPFSFGLEDSTHVKDPAGRTYYRGGPVLTVIDVPQPNFMTRQEWRANKLLFLHCRNNFMKALATLKDARSALQHHGLYGDATAVDATIRELEEVKQ